jgi:hypothetical protein
MVSFIPTLTQVHYIYIIDKGTIYGRLGEGACPSGSTTSVEILNTPIL